MAVDREPADGRTGTCFGCGQEARESLFKNSQYIELAMNQHQQSAGSIGPTNPAGLRELL